MDSKGTGGTGVAGGRQLQDAICRRRGAAAGGYDVNPLLQSFEMIDDSMADILRQKTRAERLDIARRLWNSARVIVRGAIRRERPDWNEEQVNHEIARRMSHGVVP